MSRRIELELTSKRADGSWTWRSAGAKEPKGDIAEGVVPATAEVGMVLRADADFGIDGIEILAVLAPKAPRKEAQTLEIFGTGSHVEGVTSSLVSKKGRSGGRDRDRHDKRSGRPGRGEKRGRDDRGRSRSNERGRDDKRRDGKRPERKPRNQAPSRPKPRRLRPRRVHRDATVAALPSEQQPLAAIVLKGGVPGVRQAVDVQNKQAREEQGPEIKAEILVVLAERLLPALKAAEWKDRAEAALKDLGTVDLRDIRSVVVAAESHARDDEAKQLAEQLRDGLTKRVDNEHNDWLREIAGTLADGRVVRALRLSSRPPKAGAPLPQDMATRLAEGASASLSADTGADRWAIVIDAIAYSPVRTQVVPEGIPADPPKELLDVVKKLASRVPTIAAAFGVEATSKPRRPRRGPRKPKQPAPAPATETPAEAAPVAEPAAPATETPAEAAPVAEPAAPATETPS